MVELRIVYAYKTILSHYKYSENHWPPKRHWNKSMSVGREVPGGREPTLEIFPIELASQELLCMAISHQCFSLILRPTFINTLFPVYHSHQLSATAPVFIMQVVFQNICKSSQIIKLWQNTWFFAAMDLNNSGQLTPWGIVKLYDED